MSLKDDKFLPGHFRAQQITQCHSGEYLSVIKIIIIGLPVAPNYKMGFLCRKKPEKPEKKCEYNLYFSKHYMYIKTTALHNRQPNEPPLWGSFSNIKNKHSAL